MARATPWSLIFHDGSGNGYRFWQEAGGEACFDYTPVTPEHSSSGFYSGGEPQAGTLSGADADALWEQAERLAGDTARHEPRRVMGSGSFRLVTPAGERRFLVRRDAARSFAESLTDYRGAGPESR